METSSSPSLINFSTEQKKKILRICNILSVVTAGLAFFFGPLLYHMSGQKIVLYPSLLEGCLFLMVPVLSYYKKNDAAIIVAFTIQTLATLYYGLILGSISPIWGMGLFLAGIALLIFEKKKIKVWALAFVTLTIAAIQLNITWQWIPTIPLSENYHVPLTNMAIATILFLNCMMLFFYNRQIRADQQVKANYIEALEAKLSLRHYVREISHEISGPLNIIHGIGTNYLREKDESRADVLVNYEHLQAINLAAISILELAANDLEWARLEAGEESKVVAAPFDLKSWLEENILLYRQMAKYQDIQLIMILPDVVPGHIISDKNKLTRILRNLLINAIKFSHPNGVVLLVVSFSDNQLTLAVRDKGKGLTPAEQANIFRPFVTSRTEFMNGTGLGLPILQKNVMELNGHIAIESTKETGTTFTVTIPVTVASQIQAVEKIVEDQILQFPHLRCLIVDDNQMNRLIMEMHLKRLSIESLHASSGADAIDIARQKLPDLILLDIYMPRGNAFEILDCLKNDQTLSSIPVIAISGEKLKDVQEAIIRAGASSFMSSPVNFVQLHAELCKLANAGVIARE